MDSNNLVLNPEIIEKFCVSFVSKLSKYKLSYYLREKRLYFPIHQKRGRLHK